jgi:hypothetical protein
MNSMSELRESQKSINSLTKEFQAESGSGLYPRESGSKFPLTNGEYIENRQLKIKKEEHPMNTRKRWLKRAFTRLIVVAGIVLLAQTQAVAQAPPPIIEDLFPDEMMMPEIEVPAASKSPIKMAFSPISSAQNLSEFADLSRELGLDGTGELISLMLLVIQNEAPIPVTTRLADLAVLTDTQRHTFAVYSLENRNRATYDLPDWDKALRIDPGQGIALRLGFILTEGEKPIFEGAAKVYGCFWHSEFNSLYHSIGISERGNNEIGEKGVQVFASKYGVQRTNTYVSPEFGEEVNPISVREVSLPKPIFSPGGRSIYLESLLGELGMDSQMPYWIGIPQAIENDDFDYETACQFLDRVAEELKAHPRTLTRNTIWLSNHGILLTLTEDKVFIATSGAEVLALPYDVVEVLRHVAGLSLMYNWSESDVEPLRGTYKPIISPNPGEVIGFEIECTGVTIRAERMGNRYKIEVHNKLGTADENAIPLKYQRRK